MRQEIRNKLKDRRESEIKQNISDAVEALNKEGYQITFGSIGKKTTYALLTKGDEEIVGYTFIKDIQYKNDLIGNYKALQQALTRKSIMEQKAAEDSEN